MSDIPIREMKGHDILAVERFRDSTCRMIEFVVRKQGNDKNPSMKVDKRFHCFACQADGDAVDFVSRLFGLPSKEAAMKLADDFGIRYDSRQKPSVRPKIREPTPEQRYQQEENHCYKVLTDYFHLLREWKQQYAPKQPEDEWHPLFVEALQRESYIEYLLDILLYGTPEEMIATANAKSIEEIKSFISRAKETYKVPYETHPADRLRQCVFGGSSNTMDFLPLDRSGNRRFLPIMVHPEKAEVHILEDEATSRAFVDMMWAEAMFIYHNFPVKLTLSKGMDKELRELQKQFMPEDTKAGLIQSFLDNYNGTQVCSKLIYAEALNHPFDEPKETLGLEVDISARIKPEWTILPKRWIVERTLAWINYSRRLSKDYEITVESAQAMCMIAALRTFIARF